MAGKFDAKSFNAEVFQKYMETIPNVKRSELIRSKAIVERKDLAAVLVDQVGGNYISTPLLGLISGSAATNYDGATNIVPKGTDTYLHSRIVVGRSNGWTEKDFSYDITGGEDFLENVAQQIAGYWEEIDQETLIHILKGVFSMEDTAGAAFVASHTNDISNDTNSMNELGKMDGISLNNAMQNACGDNKSKFNLAIMHSVVATHLENLKILVYAKYNDENGMERDVAFATLNGRTVLIDDGMPSTAVPATAGVYEIAIGGTVAADDVISVGGVTVTLDATSGASKNAAASAVKDAIDADAVASEIYSTAVSGAKITLTEKTGHYGNEPVVSITSTAGTIAKTVKTAPIAVGYTLYTTYVLGDGAIEFTDCGAKVPYEMDRDPKTNGGEDTLYSRQRKCFAPYGISFTKASMSTASPTDSELENGTNWELVNNGLTDTAKKYISSKAIPIARIISRG